MQPIHRWNNHTSSNLWTSSWQHTNVRNCTLYRFCQICDLNNHKMNSISWRCSQLCNNHKRIMMQTLIFVFQHQFTYNNTTSNSWHVAVSNACFDQTFRLASSNQNAYALCMCQAYLLNKNHLLHMSLEYNRNIELNYVNVIEFRTSGTVIWQL